MIDLLRGVLSFVLGLYVAMMWARLVLDYARFFAPGWRPRGILLVLCEAVYSLTDPPLKLVRKVVPPLRVGAVALDLAWMVVMIALGVLQTLVTFIR
ncbi:hypothetical protein USB125703_01999 [Pseudoclavibacter triregionum]|nr:hypothetical protein USB125703_01999 [Pseudoclavibacter triregionum]